MDTRWIQRFNNLNKAISSLSVSLLEDTSNNITLRAGVIQFFEMTFVLAWKTLKDYLNEIGYDEVNSPRSAIKKAFEIGIVDDGHLWLKALEDRNLTAHTYEEETAIEVERLIRESYYPMVLELQKKLEQVRNAEGV
ncbi:nucleotidyltransferase substrate binding protein [Acetobacteroides hydrogenigenes]|uniref:Nucleotidyltransferase substrate binding protein (TIGR01987 family) n=1 Tax=Acetobacteroides hydrogenigenes TaxID=979970 RepID=A0A4R2E4A5_9BACT|nr:nucleotidyltransferase substrate binding protein [Acetobacteroides hydrogenigenes]TCN62217.1 nucleotidyltransferase substrate binding protein (TIGR01987 family) [Acetobacteroides hydrogenigenes]